MPRRRTDRPWSSREAAEGEARWRFGPEAWAIVRRTWDNLREELHSGRDLDGLAKNFGRLCALLVKVREFAERHHLDEILDDLPAHLAELEERAAESRATALGALDDGARSFEDARMAALARKVAHRRGGRRRRGQGPRPGRAALLRTALTDPRVRRATLKPRGRDAVAWACAGIALGLDEPIDGPDRDGRSEREQYDLRVNDWRRAVRDASAQS